MQEQQQQQHQMQVPSQQSEPKKIIINSETIEMIKIKLRALGPGPFSPEDQKKHDQLKGFMARAIQILQQQQLHQQQNQQQQQQQVQQQQPQLITTQAHVPATAVSQVQPSGHPQQMQQTIHQIQQQQQQQPQQQPQQPQQQQPQPQQQHHHPPPPQSSQSQSHPHPTPQQQLLNLQPQSSLNSQIIDKKALQDLVKEVDPSEQLDEDVEELLLQVADDFIENVITNSCQLAKHRKSNMLEAKDVQFHLERNYNIWVPGFATDELKTHKKALPTEAHKQRLMLIKKSTTGPGAGPGTSQNKDK